MIDRSPSRLHVCLRPPTFAFAAIISAIAFLALPLAALVCIVAGGFAYVVCVFVMLLLGLVAGLLAIAGGIALIAGLCGGNSDATGGGIVAGFIGVVGLALHDQYSKPVYVAGEAALTQCNQAAQFLTSDLFIGYDVYVWSWSVLAIVAVLALAILATIGVLRCEAIIKARLLGIQYTCPVDHERGVPHFRCSKCSTLIRDLVPSPYGIFHARCATCQTELPTLDVLGRLSLHKVCRHCSADLVHPAIGKRREVHVGIVGAQSSGKSTWMIASLWQFVEQFASKNGLQVEFSNDQQKKTLYDFVARLASGTRLAKTVSMDRPRAFNVAFHPTDDSGCLLYLYDAAGEDFKEEATMSGHRFHRFVDGLVLVIDPFAEAITRHGKTRPADRKAWAEVSPAATDVGSVFQPFVSRLERQMNVPAEGRFPIPIAVVVTKMHALAKPAWFDEVPKASRVAGGISRPQGTGKVITGKGASSQIRDFLLSLGLDNLVLGLETRFRTVAYFTTSAIEELLSAGRALASPRSAMPLLWLIQQRGSLSASSSASGVPTPVQSPKSDL